MTNSNMAKQILLEQYQLIEKKRVELKEKWCQLKNNKGDKEEIKRIGMRLTQLTLNQAHILINLEY